MIGLTIYHNKFLRCQVRSHLWCEADFTMLKFLIRYILPISTKHLYFQKKILNAKKIKEKIL